MSAARPDFGAALTLGALYSFYAGPPAHPIAPWYGAWVTSPAPSPSEPQREALERRSREDQDDRREREALEQDAAEWRKRMDQGAEDVGLLDQAQLDELAAWLTPDARRERPVSADADAFIAASRAVLRRRWWWPGKSTVGSALAVLVILMILATPITLLSIVGLTAALIHRTLN